MQKPVSMERLNMGSGERLYVVCDDGAVWYLEAPWIAWVPGPSIPDSDAWKSLGEK